MKRKLLCLLLLLSLLLGTAPISAFAANQDINVSVNGKNVVWTDAKPFIDSNNRTLVPLRSVAEAMGLEVTWDAETKTAGFIGTKNFDKDGKNFTAKVSVDFIIDEYGGEYDARLYYGDIDLGSTLGNDQFAGYIMEMDTSAIIKNNRTFAPIRYLAEYFGYTVEWDGNTKTVILTGGDILTEYFSDAIKYSNELIQYHTTDRDIAYAYGSGEDIEIPEKLVSDAHLNYGCISGDISFYSDYSSVHSLSFMAEFEGANCISHYATYYTQNGTKVIYVVCTENDMDAYEDREGYRCNAEYIFIQYPGSDVWLLGSNVYVPEGNTFTVKGRTIEEIETPSIYDLTEDEYRDAVGNFIQEKTGIYNSDYDSYLGLITKTTDYTGGGKYYWLCTLDEYTVSIIQNKANPSFIYEDKNNISIILLAIQEKLGYLLDDRIVSIQDYEDPIQVNHPQYGTVSGYRTKIYIDNYSNGEEYLILDVAQCFEIYKLTSKNTWNFYDAFSW